jgi:hypothetical protein
LVVEELFRTLRERTGIQIIQDELESVRRVANPPRLVSRYTADDGHVYDLEEDADPGASAGVEGEARNPGT